MTQIKAVPKNGPTAFPAPANQSHKGLFLVDLTDQREKRKMESKIARQSRSLGMLALAGAALAAPLLWVVHAVLHALHIR